MLLQDVFSHITNWVNQRWSTLLLWTKSIIQYINYGLLEVYFFEWKMWNFMRTDHSFTLDQYTTVGEVQEVSLAKNIGAIHTISTNAYSIWNWTTFPFTPKNSPDGMVEWEYYVDEFAKKIYFAKWKKSADVKITYYGYTLFTETNNPTFSEEIHFPQQYMPALYHFTMAFIYPHYTQYGENRETSAYQMGSNYLSKMSQSQTTVVNYARPKQ